MVYAFGLLLLLASWLQPLHFLPWVSWHSEVLAFLAALYFAWLMLFALIKQSTTTTVSIPSAALPFLYLGVLICAQWGFGKIPFLGDALVFVAYLLLCVSCIVWGYFSHNGQPALPMKMATVILVSAFASAVIALLQAFELTGELGCVHNMPTVRRPGANMGQPNQLATLLLMGLASVVYMLESNKFGRVVALSIVLVLLLALAATESRAGLLGFMVLTTWWFVKRKPLIGRISPWAIMSFGAAYLSIFWLWPTVMGELYQLPGGVLPTNAVGFNRWIIWPQLLHAAFMRPWMGWGLGQVSTAHNAVVDAYLVSEPYTYAHNIVLDLVLGIGFPLTMLLVVATGAWLWRRIRAEGNLTSWYLVAVVIPVAVHSLVEFPFAYAYFLVPVMFALGSIDANLGFQTKTKWRIGPIVTGLSIATAVFSWSIFEYQIVEEDFRIVRFESMRVGQTPNGYEKPKVYLFSQLDALLISGRVIPKPEMSAPEIELAKKVANRYPWIATQNRYALALALNNNREEASRQLLVMRAQHGEKAYDRIKDAWRKMATERYLQLQDFTLP